MTALIGSIRSFAGGIAFALTGIFPAHAPAQEVVDVELILAVDVSLSMSYDELAIQRDGYVAALTHDTVVNAIRDGIHGRIAIAYFEWAGDHSQYMVVPWTVISSREDAERVAAQITASPPNSARRTSISGALRFAQDLFAESPYRGLKRVIDVSGDGPNNQGELVSPVRDEVIASGIAINGLPLMTDGGIVGAFDVPNLDRYYAECVVGGPGAFVIPVNEWAHFPEAVRRKLVLEIADTPFIEPWFERGTDGPLVVPVADEAPYDCEIGEKRWRGRGWGWDDMR